MDKQTASLIGSFLLGRPWQWSDNWGPPKDQIHVAVMVLGSEEGRRRINALLDYLGTFYSGEN